MATILMETKMNTMSALDSDEEEEIVVVTVYVYYL